MHNRAEKKIASLLSISPRTVAAHIHNIMGKLQFNSKEQIIDLVEKSSLTHRFREYYPQILMELNFKEQLQRIGIIIRQNSKLGGVGKGELDYNEKNFTIKQNELISEFISHLKLANISLQKDNKSDDFTTNNSQTSFSLRICNDENDEANSIRLHFIKADSNNELVITQANYSKDFFNLLKRIVINAENINFIEQIEADHQQFIDSWQIEDKENENIITQSYNIKSIKPIEEFSGFSEVIISIVMLIIKLTYSILRGILFYIFIIISLALLLIFLN